MFGFHGIGLPVPAFPPSGLPAILSPLEIANLNAWYDASDISTLFQDNAGATPVTTNGDPVGRWADKSGNANHINQGAAGAKPAYTTGVQNGLAGLSFDGGDYLDSTATITPESATLFVVLKTNLVNSATYGILSARHSSNGGAYLQQNVANNFRATRTPSSLNAVGATPTATTAYIVAGAFNAAGGTIYVNGNASVTASAVYSGVTPQPWRMGGSLNNSTAEMWAGRILMACIYSRAITAGEKGQLFNYANAIYGVY